MPVIGRDTRILVVAIGVGFAVAAASWRVVIAGSEPRAPQRLEDTGLYEPGRFGVVAAKNRRFSPQYPLWTDGATKARWVFLPSGTTVDATNPDEWQLPIGTRFWKEFSFNGRRVETRLLWKAGERDWVFASYAWNEAQTEATLVPAGGLPGVVEVAPGRRHSIPSQADCRACHDSAGSTVLGFNALQLSTDRDPHAPHAERLDAGMVTLRTLAEEGLLTPERPELLDSPPRIPADDPRTRAVLGYLSTNCGTCHNARSSIAAARMLLEQTGRPADASGNQALHTIVNRSGTWMIPGPAEEPAALVLPGAPERSAIVHRMTSRRPSSQMPPLGSVLPDREAIDLVTTWIRDDLVEREGGR